MNRPVVLATRGSDLALAQTRDIAAKLRDAWRGLDVVEEIIRTRGDQNLDADLARLGALDKGLFTKELEAALLEQRADAAVHSLKDLPTTLPEGLALGAILRRAPDEDILVSKHDGGLDALPAGAKVGTGSPRRQAMLRAQRPDLHPALLRGNVPTRLRKLAEGNYDAIILAAAGLQRLGWTPHGAIEIPGAVFSATTLDKFLPAPGQGAVAVEIRDGDGEIIAHLQPLHDEATARCVRAERSVLSGLGGGCHMALGTRARIVKDQIILDAVVFDDRGWQPKHASATGPADDPETLGRLVADLLHGD
jgi:hydroxymethylbilane synthase